MSPWAVLFVCVLEKSTIEEKQTANPVLLMSWRESTEGGDVYSSIIKLQEEMSR